MGLSIQVLQKSSGIFEPTLCEENRRDMGKYKPHVLSMKTYASKSFENMHKGTFCL